MADGGTLISGAVLLAARQAMEDIAGPDALAVRLVKRRGPALEQPVLLALPPVLSRAARQRALTPRRTRTSVPVLSAIA